MARLGFCGLHQLSAARRRESTRVILEHSDHGSRQLGHRRGWRAYRLPQVLIGASPLYGSRRVWLGLCMRRQHTRSHSVISKVGSRRSIWVRCVERGLHIFIAIDQGRGDGFFGRGAVAAAGQTSLDARHSPPSERGEPTAWRTWMSFCPSLAVTSGPNRGLDRRQSMAGDAWRGSRCVCVHDPRFGDDEEQDLLRLSMGQRAAQGHSPASPSKLRAREPSEESARPSQAWSPCSNSPF
jgi:hypothetical protein